jgi:beta-lactamase class C
MRSRPTRRNVVALCACLLAPLAASAIEAAPTSKPAAAAPLPRIVRVAGDQPLRFEAILAEHQLLADQVIATGQVVGMAVAVVKDGRVVSAKARGVLDASTRVPATATSAFRIASLSKAFASAVAARLVEERYLDWDDPVQQLVPSFELSDAQGAARLTIRELLSQRTGLPYNTLDKTLESGDESYPLLVWRLRSQPMMCAVGACYAYQNVAYSVIGDVTFASSGDFYAHKVVRQIFLPLGMARASFGLDGLKADDDWARPHKRGPRGWVVLEPKDNYYRLPPAAGINASIGDVAQWMLAQLGHRPDVLSPELLATVHEPQVATPHEIATSQWRRERVRKAHYAMGWRVFDYAGHRVVFHAGAVQGYRAMLALLPDHDTGIAVLWNCETGVPSGLVPTYLDRYLGLPARDWLELSSYRRPTLAATAAGTRR